MVIAIFWDEASSLIAKLGATIKADGESYDLIVAIARGGFVPARLLSGHLGVKRLASIGLVYEDETRTSLGVYAFPEPIVEGTRVLLVEDALESGKSLIRATELLRERGAIVKTAALFISQSVLIQPDFTLGVVADIPVFPWE